MASSREEIKQRIREAADIVQVIGEHVKLKKTGSRFTGLCPFHAEKTPSFSVNPQMQFFHCFGCGESGDVFSFLMKYHHLSFPEALAELARRYNIALPRRTMTEAERKQARERETLYAANEKAAEIYHRYLLESREAENARDYLKNRGVSTETILKYRLGYAPDPDTAGWTFITSRLQAERISIRSLVQVGLAVASDRGGHYDRFRDRILFPILDQTGRVVAFGGRILGEGKPKYMNSPESPIFNKSRLLFGLFQHRENIRKRQQALIVEGNFDMLLLAVHGVDNVVAPLGTALTRPQIRALRNFCPEVVLLFDGDAAGLKAARRSIPLFLAEQVEGRVALLPDGHDPDSLVREKGPDAVAGLVAEARPLAEFVFDALVEEYGLTLSGKNRIITELRELLTAAVDEGQRTLMAAHFGEKLGIAPAHFLDRTSPGPVRATGRQAEGGRRTLYDVSRKYRQLVDFLVFHPEYLPDLQAAGLEEVVEEPVVLEVFQAISAMKQDEEPGPENLVHRIAGEKNRQYLVELLMRGPDYPPDRHKEEGRRMCDELLAWLADIRGRHDAANLLEQIREAQQSGDQGKLMELLKKKQEVARKSTSATANQLKKNTN